MQRKPVSVLLFLKQVDGCFCASVQQIGSLIVFYILLASSKSPKTVVLPCRINHIDVSNKTTEHSIQSKWNWNNNTVCLIFLFMFLFMFFKICPFYKAIYSRIWKQTWRDSIKEHCHNIPVSTSPICLRSEQLHMWTFSHTYSLAANSVKIKACQRVSICAFEHFILIWFYSNRLWEQKN